MLLWFTATLLTGRGANLARLPPGEGQPIENKGPNKFLYWMACNNSFYVLKEPYMDVMK